MAALSELWRKVKPTSNPYEELDVEDLLVKRRSIRNTIALYKGHLALYNAKSCLTDDELCRKSELERSIEAEEYWLELCSKALACKTRHESLHYCKGCLLYERYKLYAVLAVLATVANLIAFVIKKIS